LNFLRFIFERQSDEKVIDDLRLRLDESEKKIEKLTEMINILATFDEKMAKDIRTVASHVALMELSMVDKRKANVVSLKRKTNDDDMIN
jgi:hypothetical protein